MTINIKSIDLKTLEQILENKINLEPFAIIPMEVTCLEKGKTLAIFIHYSEASMPYPKRLFALIRSTLSERGITGEIQMYLVVKGENQLLLPSGDISGETINWNGEFNPNAIVKKSSSLEDNSDLAEGLILKKNNYLDQNDSSWLWDSIVLKSQLESHDLPLEKKPNLSRKIYQSIAIYLLSFGCVFGVMYALTRPCVIGKCQTISDAQNLALSSSEILDRDSSLNQIIKAVVDLKTSINLLESIPQWSTYYSEATNILQEYETKLTNLERIINAIATAKVANQKTENLPLLPSDWQEIQELWQDAIGNLEQASSTLEFSSFTQNKIAEYEQNLAQTNEYLLREKNAVENFKLAQEKANLAQIESNVAQSIENWEMAENNWISAIKKLEYIPQNTTVSLQAKRSMERYTSRLIAVRKHKEEEKLARNLYEKAVEDVEKAKLAEEKNQWSTAVNHWNYVINYLQQIPQNTYQYRQLQPTIDEYTTAFVEAKVKLQAALALEKAKSDLQKVCIITPRICNYQFQDETIELRLTSSYMQQIWETNIQAKQEGDFNTQSQLQQHILSVENTLKNISKTTGMNVKVYNPKGIVMIEYVPEKI